MNCLNVYKNTFQCCAPYLKGMNEPHSRWLFLLSIAVILSEYLLHHHQQLICPVAVC